MTDPSVTRVRFAPSPTGSLHVGGLRTALYNYLFARHNEGVFVLRIEDTDRTRYVPGAAESLIETLRWTGLAFDEGPGMDTPVGPYVQSERLPAYRAHAERLLAEGNAYRCFCTPEQIEASRTEAGMYNKTCRPLRVEESAGKAESGMPHTIRLRVPDEGETSFTDLIRGQISMLNSLVDDQVLLKSDGFPTYHLANVVDDHLMNITHVIRGEEWLPSTPKHVLLYDFFEWQKPAFAHLPLLLNTDRSKLSKRQGDVSVEDYRQNGYLAPALLNFIALLGWNTSDDREMYTLDELVKEFSLERVGKSGAIFDVEKLRWFNGQYLRDLDDDALAGLCLPHLASQGWEIPTREAGTALVTALRSYLTVPGDIIDRARVFFEPDVEFENENARDIVMRDTSRAVYKAVSGMLAGLDPWERSGIKQVLSAAQSSTGIKGKDFFQPVRIALTGASHGPDLPVIAELLGRRKCLDRLLRHIDHPAPEA